MIKKVNKKILFGVFGSLLIGISSIITPIMVISNTQKGVLNYSKKFNFSNEKDIRNSFNRANISIETTNNYINSVKNLKQSKLYSSSTSLLENIIEVQNQISLRKVNNNSLLEELNFDIKNVKNVLKKDSDAYLNYQKTDKTNYEYLRALYVKNNVDSWSSLNNVKRYDLIYGYLNTVYESIENFYELYYLKQLINKIEIEIREKQIQDNEIKIEQFKNEIKTSNKNIKKSIEQIEEITNRKISNGFYEHINDSWNIVNKSYWIAISLTSTAAVLSTLTFIPIFGKIAFAVGVATSLAASGMSLSLSGDIQLLRNRINQTGASSIEIISFLGELFSFYLKVKNPTGNLVNEIIEVAIKKIFSEGAKLTIALSAVTIVLAVFELWNMTSNYLSIKKEKDNFIKSSMETFNNSIDEAVQKENLKIKNLNSYIYSKNLKIEKMKKVNSSLYSEVLEKQNDQQNLNLNFDFFHNSIKSIPSLSMNKINSIKENVFKSTSSLKKISLSKLYEKYNSALIKKENNKIKRKDSLINFNYFYNYDDKKYWKNISNNFIEKNFINLYSLFLIS